MNSMCGASHREFRCQENHQQSMCTAIITDNGIDECQSTQAKSKLTRGRHLQLELEETYLLDLRLLAAGDCGALNFVCNLAACEPETFLRGICREGLLKHRARATAVLKKTVLNTISLCVDRNDHPSNVLTHILAIFWGDKNGFRSLY
ncbi:hypothetical protein Bpfe_003356 [Biomphalaria pfeifferi]|uniref:Uncharacterized protein n=1 Tax=Biomphalaria pfeifferi TaxID=112525 RepID=A0AAD8C6Y4_BIOPF|nr:hypothetical protein Bpfe_003356 [Biomphalaria pfeifferi]